MVRGLTTFSSKLCVVRRWRRQRCNRVDGTLRRLQSLPPRHWTDNIAIDYSNRHSTDSAVKVRVTLAQRSITQFCLATFQKHRPKHTRTSKDCMRSTLAPSVCAHERPFLPLNRFPGCISILSNGFSAAPHSISFSLHEIDSRNNKITRVCAQRAHATPFPAGQVQINRAANAHADC